MLFNTVYILVIYIPMDIYVYIYSVFFIIYFKISVFVLLYTNILYMYVLLWF